MTSLAAQWDVKTVPAIILSLRSYWNFWRGCRSRKERGEGEGGRDNDWAAADALPNNTSCNYRLLRTGLCNHQLAQVSPSKALTMPPSPCPSVPIPIPSLPPPCTFFLYTPSSTFPPNPNCLPPALQSPLKALRSSPLIATLV